MTCQPKPIVPFDPKSIAGISEKVLVSFTYREQSMSAP